jgi:hypothetical protein
MRPVYDEGGITLYHADAKTMFGSIGADVILTDPPNELAGVDLMGEFGVEKMSVLVNVATVGAWTDDERPSSTTVWRRPEPTKDGSDVDVMLHFGHTPTGLSWIDDRGPRDTEHPAERGLKPWCAVMVGAAPTPRTVFLDPFAGSGTTLVAARSFHMRAIGIEHDDRWIAVILARLRA